MLAIAKGAAPLGRPGRPWLWADPGFRLRPRSNLPDLLSLHRGVSTMYRSWWSQFVGRGIRGRVIFAVVRKPRGERGLPGHRDAASADAAADHSALDGGPRHRVRHRLRQGGLRRDRHELPEPGTGRPAPSSSSPIRRDERRRALDRGRLPGVDNFSGATLLSRPPGDPGGRPRRGRLVEPLLLGLRPGLHGRDLRARLPAGRAAARHAASDPGGPCWRGHRRDHRAWRRGLQR